jgi:hypothetical protein
VPSAEVVRPGLDHPPSMQGEGLRESVIGNAGVPFIQISNYYLQPGMRTVGTVHCQFDGTYGR